VSRGRDQVAPVRVSFERTRKLSVSRELNTGKMAAIKATHDLYVEMLRFFVDFFTAHYLLVEARDAKAALPACEGLVLSVPERKVRGQLRPARRAMEGWDFVARSGPVPRDVRRAAINAAYGHLVSHQAQVEAWEEAGKKGRCPKLGAPANHPVLYAQVANLSSVFYQQGHVRLCLLDPSSGERRWYNVPVTGRPGTLALLERSEAERARRAAAREAAVAACKRQGRMKDGKPVFSETEKAEVRLMVGAVQSLSPTLVVTKKGKVSLNVAFQQVAEVVRAEPGRIAGLHQTVMAVDTNTHNVSAVIKRGHKVLAVRKLSYAPVTARREKAVGTAVRKARLSGRRPRGEHQNIVLWGHISNQGETAARQAAAWLTRLAVAYKVTVIVFEHLRPYRPRREGRSTRSARANRRRGYWLRGKIRSYTADRALAEGVLTVERNPAWTSSSCPRCHRLGERSSASTTKQANKARFQCGHCGWAGDADIVAALNLHLKWGRSFVYPAKDEVKAWKAAGRPKTLPQGKAALVPNPRLVDSARGTGVDIKAMPGSREAA
jgi:putative transposase